MESIKQLNPFEEKEEDKNRKTNVVVFPLDLKLAQLEAVLHLAETWLSVQTICEVKKNVLIKELVKNKRKASSTRIGREGDSSCSSSSSEGEE